MRQKGEMAKATISSEITRIKDTLARAQRIDRQEAIGLLEPVLQEVADTAEGALRRYKAHPLWRRLVWPSRSTFVDNQQLHRHRNFYRLWRTEYRKALNLAKRGADITARTANLRRRQQLASSACERACDSWASLERQPLQRGSTPSSYAK